MINDDNNNNDDNKKSSLSSCNCRWYGEWEHHSCCILLYPHNSETFLGRLRHRTRQEFINIVRAIALYGHESVLVYCPTEREATTLRQEFIDDPFTTNPDVCIHVDVCPSDDTWARDTAPTFLVGVDGDNEDKNDKHQQHQRRLIGLDWDFNAYGGPTDGCYWPCEQDKLIASRICNNLASNAAKYFGGSDSASSSSSTTTTKIVVEHRKVNLILEGGSIHTDGCGTILTTEECLLNKNRNPHFSKHQIESIVLSRTHCTKMIWLSQGLDGDVDTNGHVDNFCCFVKPQHVVLAWTDDNVRDKINYDRCRLAHDILSKSTDALGRKLFVHKLYLPKPIYYAKELFSEYNNTEADAATGSGDANDNDPEPPQQPMIRQVGERMAASYVNFYIANKAVIVPQFSDEIFDRKAIETLQRLFNDHDGSTSKHRKVIGVPSLEILIGGGNIHCITQQVPSINIDKNND